MLISGRGNIAKLYVGLSNLTNKFENSSYCTFKDLRVEQMPNDTKQGFSFFVISEKGYYVREWEEEAELE